MKTIRTLAIALTLASSLPAFADDTVDGPEPKQLTVSYAGLDLGTQQGVARLYTRIWAAAHNVCRNLETREPGPRFAQWRKCINTAIADAVADVNAPMLTAYASYKRGNGVQSSTVAKSK